MRFSRRGNIYGYVCSMYSIGAIQNCQTKVSDNCRVSFPPPLDSAPSLSIMKVASAATMGSGRAVVAEL